MEINKTTKKDLYMIDPRNIVVVEGFNSRRVFDLDSLVQSITENGVLNPLTCISFTDKEGNKKYRLVDGERRYRACMKAIENGAEIARVPAILISSKTSEQELLLQQLVRNDGKQFNEYEMAIACDKFIKWGWTKSEIAKKLGKNPAYVTFYLQHLDRDQRIQKMLQEDKISGAEVRSIYAQHKDPKTKEVDEDSAVKEILLGVKKAEMNGKKRVTIKDMSDSSKTKTSIDSKKIKSGLDILIKYYKKYIDEGKEFNLDIIDIINQLKEGKNITEIFDDASTAYRKAE